jgi:sensor histidine kinase YesM
MSYQAKHSFVFSNNPYDRIKRHAAFWAVIFLYHLLRIGIMYPPERISYYLPAILELAIYWGVLSNMALSYTIIYFLIPRFFQKKKYVQFTFYILVLIVVLFIISFYHNNYISTSLSQVVAREKTTIPVMTRAYIIRFFGNQPLILGLLLSLKTFKNWYIEISRNEMLAKETSHAELQLLKAQVHPHFLFNTLNNIYAFTIIKSPTAAKMVRHLNDTLHYMIMDCSVELVPLKKEIKLLKDYISLEKVRYGNRLNIQLEITGNPTGKTIPPLLMIPFLENSFKHGTSKMLEHPWINLQIDIKHHELFFSLANSKPLTKDNPNHKKGIGLKNVVKRLVLLYPDRHDLLIESSDAVFNVKLRTPLYPEKLSNSISINRASITDDSPGSFG